MNLSLRSLGLYSEVHLLAQDSQRTEGKMLESFKHVRMLDCLTQPVKPVRSHKMVIAGESNDQKGQELIWEGASQDEPSCL